jgi:hypothetical protein
MSATFVKIEIVEGKIAPRYPETSKMLQLEKSVITENGMESNLPLVDIVLKDQEGNEFFFMVSGRIINALSAAIKGINLRNHGCEEP